MTTSAKAGYGTTFSWNAVTIAELTKIGNPKINMDMLDVTTHDSATRFREFIAGLGNGGEVAIEGFLKYTDTTGQLAMVTDGKAGTERAVVITLPSSIATWSFQGLITNIELGEAPVDGPIPFSASIQVTGSPTLATSASNNITVLALTTGTLYPVFAAATYEYSATSVADTLTVTATFAAGVCAMYVNDTLQENLTTAVASGAVSLGANGTMTQIKLIVTETNKTPKTYEIYVANLAA